MNNLINTIDKLASEMSEDEQTLYTPFFQEILEIGLGFELEEIIDKHFYSLFSEVLGKNLTMTINYQSNYHIKIKISKEFRFQHIDIIPYKLIDRKEVLGYTNDSTILPISNALRFLYPDQCMFTDKLLTIRMKSKQSNYQPWLYPFKSIYTDKLLQQIPLSCNYLSKYTSDPKFHKNYHPLIMFAYKKKWANDIIYELKEVIALVKKVVKDESKRVL